MNPGYKDTREKSRELRRWVAQRLKMVDVPEPLWKFLEDKHHVSETLQEPNKKEETLLKPAREYLRLFKDMAASPGCERVFKEETADSYYASPSSPDDPTYERTRAAATYLLKRIETFPEVKSIRQKLNAPPSPEEARDFIRAPASARGSGSSKGVVLLSDGLKRGAMEVEKGSLLWELSETAKRLPRGPWRPEYIAWWILTGKLQVKPLYAVLNTGGNWPTFELTVPAWASAEAVGRFHKEAKKMLLPVPPAPTPSSRRLAVFQFVAEQGEYSEDEGDLKVGGWRKVMTLWNQHLPEDHGWRYIDVRNFSRDFRETKKALFSREA